MNASTFTALNILKFLEKNGITDVCLAPGSRSAPFALLADNFKNLKIHIHFDERALAFLALGISLASNKPVAIITTSGSAVGNLLPAIMEANASHVPLVIISSDRPFELINSGANQVCNQDHIFGEYANFIHIPVIDEQLGFGSCNSRLKVLFEKTLLTGKPLHINVELRAPLYEKIISEDYDEKLERKIHPSIIDNAPDFQNLIENFYTNESLCIVGYLDPEYSKLVRNFIAKTGIPTIADIQSQLRDLPTVHDSYEIFLETSKYQKSFFSFKKLIVIGGRFISQKLWNAIEHFPNEVLFLSKYEDDINAVNRECEFSSALPQFLETSLKASVPSFCDYLDDYPNLYEITNGIKSEKLSETTAILKLRNSKNILFLGNSLTARIADALLSFNDSNEIYTNRGVSGIDGLIATASGISIAKNKTVVAVIGDTSALYDLSSLFLLKNCHLRLIIINNDGGRIFEKFPFSDENKREKYFINSHGLHFEDFAKGFHIPYKKVNDLPTLEALLNDPLTESEIIEISCPPKGYELFTGKINELKESFEIHITK